MERQGTRVERRARRTRTLLQQALWGLLRQQRFDSITIQEIAEHADVNRTTLYAYFPDKYALLESTLRERFRQALAEKFPATGGKWDAASMRMLIRSSYEFLIEVQRLGTPFDTQMELLLGKLVQSELTVILSVWLGDAEGAKAPARPTRVRLKTVVSATSWVILGTVIEWAFQRTLDKETLSPDEITEQVLLILTEGVARLAPELLT
ncbi:MAG: TetR/AcrR family transcriptional regulator [Ktedonobacterales bacterium]